MMIPNQNGVIESATEPIKNRRLYWFNTATDKMYKLNSDGQYELLEKEIEIITNSNGTATKYPNGTLICSRWITIPANQGNISLVFPHKFIDANYTVSLTNVFSYSSYIIYSVADNTGESIKVYAKDTQTHAVPTVSVSAMYTAIGRWK